jgi:hypothetical protein
MKLKLEDAVRRWVEEFNAIPQSLIEKAYGFDEIYEMELTPVGKIYSCDTCGEEFDKEVYETANENENGDKICPTCLDSELEDYEDEDEAIEFCTAYIEEEDDYDNHEYGLPMWGTLWAFNSSFDADWAKDNLEVLKELGFRVYESDEIGVFIGIDGAGYSFFDEHWTPLYKARGLRWHSEESE